jgi:hypothetical protein
VRTVATSLAVLATFAASLAHAAPPAHRRLSDLLPRFAIHGDGPLAPTVTFGVRGNPGRYDGLLSRPKIHLWRALPELVVRVQPSPALEIFAGGGAGAAYVTGRRGRGRRGRVRETDLALSVSLGATFDFQGVPLTASARAESVVGQGAAVMLRLKIDFSRRR